MELLSACDTGAVFRSRRILFVVLAFVHAAITLGMVIYHGSLAMASFDSGVSDWKADAASLAATILLSPGYFVWIPWASSNLPNSVEWLVFAANSALWAAASMAVITRARGVAAQRASDSN